MRAPQQLNGRDLLAVALIVVIWGTNFVAMKVGLRSFTPFQLGAARFLFGTLPLVLLVARPALRWKWVVLFGFFQGFGQFALLFLSLRVGMTAALASVLMQTQMFFTAIFSFFLLAETPRRTLLFGMLFASLGLACFGMNYIGPATGSAGATTLLGFALCLGAAAMWSVSNIIVRLAQKETPDFNVLSFLAWGSMVPIPLFLLMSLWLDPPTAHAQWLAAPWPAWLSAAYIGWVGTVLAYSLWTQLIKRHGANKIGPFSLGVPVVGLACGMLWLNEPITAWQWGGIGLTAVALACVILGDRIAQRR